MSFGAPARDTYATNLGCNRAVASNFALVNSGQVGDIITRDTAGRGVWTAPHVTPGGSGSTALLAYQDTDFEFAFTETDHETHAVLRSASTNVGVNYTTTVVLPDLTSDLVGLRYRVTFNGMDDGRSSLTFTNSENASSNKFFYQARIAGGAGDTIEVTTFLGDNPYVVTAEYAQLDILAVQGEGNASNAFGPLQGQLLWFITGTQTTSLTPP